MSDLIAELREQADTELVNQLGTEYTRDLLLRAANQLEAVLREEEEKS